MKVTVLQEDLLKGLISCSHFVSSRAQLPVLSNILLVAEKSKLKLTATNLELGISLQIGAKVEKDGGITVPSRMIVELISNLPAGQIILEEKIGSLYLSTLLFSGKLSGISQTEFPQVAEKLEKISFSLPRDIVQTLANQVVFASAQDSSRPTLTGVLLLFGEKLIAVATDGFRLSIKEIVYSGKKTKEEKIKLLIPGRVIDEACKVFREGDVISVLAQEKEKRLLLGTDTAVLSSKLLEGDFPDYERIIPVKWISKATVGKGDLSRAVKTASVFAREAASVVRMDIMKGKIKITAESKQYGSEEIFVDAKTEGDEVGIAYNYRYILEFLESISSEEVSIETEGPASPGVFTATDDTSYKHLIMPVRIQ